MENQQIIKLFYKMLRVRVFEEKVAKLYELGKIKADVYMSIGQEAVAAGASLAMKGKDKIFASHRNFATSICSEMDIEKIFREILGVSGGYNDGRGGPYYLADYEVGNYGSSFLPAGNVSEAVGMAFSERINGTSNVVLSFIGEGSVNEGIFHESLNLASSIKVPIIFVVENNEYSKATKFSNLSTIDSIAKRASSYSMPAIIVDGNDAIETYNAITKAIEYSREKNKPIMVEAKTYRFSGHHLGDNELYRSDDEVKSWYERCPIKILSEYMIANHIGTNEDIVMMKEKIALEMDEILDRVLSDYDIINRVVYTMPKEAAMERPIKSKPVSEKDVKTEKKKLRSYLETQKNQSRSGLNSILYSKNDDKDILVSGAKTGFPASLDNPIKNDESEILTTDNYKTYVDEDDDIEIVDNESLVDLESVLNNNDVLEPSKDTSMVHSNIMDFLKKGGE